MRNVTALPTRATANAAASLLAYTVSLGVGLVYTPFLVERLGVATYGLIPLTLTVVTYFGFLSQSFSIVSFQRLSAHVGDAAAYNRVFSTAVGLSLILAAIAAVIGAAVTMWLDVLFVLPAGFEGAARIFMQRCDHAGSVRCSHSARRNRVFA